MLGIVFLSSSTSPQVTFYSVVFQMSVLFYSALKQQVSENSFLQLHGCLCLTHKEPPFCFFALGKYFLMLLCVLP